MKISAISRGTSVFVDANLCIYAFSGDPVFGPSCIDFLERIELGDVQGNISATVLGEVAHRLMTLEACQKMGWPYTGIASRLRRHPAEVQSLTQYRMALLEIVATGIRIQPVSGSLILRAGELSQQHGLLAMTRFLSPSWSSKGFQSWRATTQISIACLGLHDIQ